MVLFIGRIDGMHAVRFDVFQYKLIYTINNLFIETFSNRRRILFVQYIYNLSILVDATDGYSYPMLLYNELMTELTGLLSF